MRKHFIRQAKPFPEDIALLFRTLDWEVVKMTFDLNDAQEEIDGASDTISRRSLQFRIVITREYLWRMEHNASVVQQCGKADQQDNLLVAADHQQERETILAEAYGMLEGASIRRGKRLQLLLAGRVLERDSQLPDYEDEADDLRAQAFALRQEAQELQTLAASMVREDQTLPALIAEAYQATQRFRRAVRPHFLKLDLLSLVLRLDSLHLISTHWALAVWHRGNGDLLRLYEEARFKATAYLSLYYDDRSFAVM